MTNISDKPIILSIAGFDPCSGAGVTSDVKTAELTGSYALGVNTAITIQHESKFTDVTWINKKEVIDQLEILLEKYNFEFIKIGLIEDISLIETIYQICPDAKIIWDPILKASAGFNFHRITSKNLLKKIAGLCYLITPNLNEWDKMKALIEGRTNILLKGGHAKNHANDILLHKDGSETTLKGERIEVTEKHGSGCVLSTAITSYLSQGYTLKEACKKGKEYITDYLQSSDSLLGTHIT